MGGQAPKSCAFGMRSSRNRDATLAAANEEVLIGTVVVDEQQCGACILKDKRIAELEMQVAHLKQQLA